MNAFHVKVWDCTASSGSMADYLSRAAIPFINFHKNYRLAFFNGCMIAVVYAENMLIMASNTPFIRNAHRSLSRTTELVSWHNLHVTPLHIGDVTPQLV